MTSELEEDLRKRCGTDVQDCLKEIDFLRLELARYKNPWTVKVKNQVTEEWTNCCHDAPLTLVNAEIRQTELRTAHPDAKFKVVPFINSWQR